MLPALVLSLTIVAATPAAAVPPPGAADARVITAWNEVAANVIPPNPAAFLNYSFVHLAMYNAVVGITGEYRLYRWDAPAPRGASPEAAAAAAAHRILMAYFPTAAGTLNAQLTASLALVPDGGAQDKGIAYGVRAADRILALRAGDGRGATVMVPTATDAGDWSPTPPAMAAFAVPWLGGVTPLVLPSLTQLDPGPPPAIGTALYRQELDEVRRMGRATGSEREEWQTDYAQYFADVPFRPMEAALRELVTRRGLDISDSARLMAATNASIADAIGSVWNSKLRYMWWRPITAIHEPFSDGDPLTEPDTTWTPLITTPPYPEWPSGLCAVVGALSTSLQRTIGTVDLKLVSPTKGEIHWTSKAELDARAVDARVWSGIHFRTADAVSISIGTQAATWAFDNYFAPSN